MLWKLTEEDGEVVDFIDQSLQSFAVDALDDGVRRAVQAEHPLQNGLFVHQITC